MDKVCLHDAPPENFTKPAVTGFTLIELSVVLVVIGLIIGGVLVGEDLIESATLRSVITQEETFQTAVATFRGKYNCLPGDCTNAYEAFGFTSQNANVANDGNGDGIIGPTNGYLFYGVWETPAPDNETATFWADLSQAGYIDNYTYGIGNGTGPGTWPEPYGLGFPSKIRQCSWWVGYGAQAAAPHYNIPVGIQPLGNVFALVGPNTQCAYETCGGRSFPKA